jgi:hypothetical protein
MLHTNISSFTPSIVAQGNEASRLDGTLSVGFAMVGHVSAVSYCHPYNSDAGAATEPTATLYVKTFDGL